MSLIFVGTPAFAVPSLRALFEAGHQISAVITRPDRPSGRGRRMAAPPVKMAAADLGLPVLQPLSLREAGVIDELRRLQPDVIVSVAYGQILRREILELAPKGVLNVHPSLLPRWRGASPIPAAILAGDDITGVSIMLMDTGLDTGPVLAQRSIPISDEDTCGTLTNTLAELGAALLAETLPSWLSSAIELQAQDDARSTVTRLVHKEDGAIDWSQPAAKIWRAVRAYNPWPGAHSLLDGQPLYFWRTWPLDLAQRAEPGVIVALEKPEWQHLPSFANREARADTFGVQTGEGILAALEVQRAGRRVLDADQFLRGMPGLIGRRLQAPA